MGALCYGSTVFCCSKMYLLVFSPGEETQRPKPKKPTFVFYTTENTVYKVNKNDPDDKEEITRVGGSHYIMDPRYKYMVYASYGNKIVKDILVQQIKPETIVSGLGNVADMIYDKRTQTVYYLDNRNNRIGKYDLKEDVGRELFSNLKAPKKLTLDRGSDSLIWTEGQGTTAVLKRGSVDGGNLRTYAKYPAVDGKEKKILFDPYTRRLYTLSGNKVCDYPLGFFHMCSHKYRCSATQFHKNFG